MRAGTAIFWLLLILILVAFFTGTASVTNSFAGGFRTLAYALTGRDVNGRFVAYPSGA